MSMKRCFDLIIAFAATIIFAIPIILIGLAVWISSSGPVISWSNRVGRENKIFRMPKFRSMKIDTPEKATHLLGDPDQYLTSIGSFIRKTSLDELPQLYCILVGDMSFVGPRPALYNQDDLIALRTKNGVHHVLPGLTGWAQINGRDELPIPLKVAFDVEYINKQSFYFDLKIICLTFIKVIKQDGVAH